MKKSNETNEKNENEEDEETSDSTPYMILPDANSSSMHLVVEGSEDEKDAMQEEKIKQKEGEVVQTSQCCIII